MKDLRELFLDELADIYDAELRLTKALPKMIKAATHEGLKEAFQNHFEETARQVERLESVFEAFGEPVKAKKCEAMLGLIREADEISSEHKNEPAIDAALISAAQKVEHYEIASYGCLREWAEQLEKDEAAEILQEILDEESAADQKLTELARTGCNEAARNGSSHEDINEENELERAGVRRTQ